MSGGDAARLAGLYFLYGHPLLEGGDERVINHKLYEAMKLAAEGLNISWEGLRRRTEGGLVAADLTISEAGIAVKYKVYLSDKIELQFRSTDRGRAELAARLLRLADVSAEIKKASGEGKWRVKATTDMLAAGREELRKALAEIVKTARDNGWVDEKKARRWLEKLEGGVVAWEGKKFEVDLTRDALHVRYRSITREPLEEVVREFKAMGLEEGVHFTVRWGGGGGACISWPRG